MLLAALALAAALDCSDPRAVQAAWEPGLAAYRSSDMAKARQVTDDLIAACGMSRYADYPRVMRAEIAIREGQNDDALAALAPVTRPLAGPLGPLSSFLALRALEGKKDAEGFAHEREALVAASAKGLADPRGPAHGKLVDSFDVGPNHVTAFETDYQDGPFRRHFVFLVASTEPFTMPRSVMLTTDPAAELLGKSQVYFIDEYNCVGHLTLELIPRRKPRYKDLKAKVVAHLNGAQQPLSGTQPSSGICAFPSYVAPGLTTE